jgi:NADH pyrophosphatase NudC (nudix superfamily)
MNELVKFCPYCGKPTIIEIVKWKAVSLEEENNEAELTEYQCFDCDNRSFWI